MNCTKCGAQNMDGVTFCGSCGAQIPQQTQGIPQQNIRSEGAGYYQQPYGTGQQATSNSTHVGNPINGGMVPPKNYMVESIVVTVLSCLCCCSPISIVLGIIAIVKANSVNAEFERGNINEAFSNADTAKKLTIWAAIVAVVYVIIAAIAYVLFLSAIINEVGGLDSFMRGY